MFQITFQQVLVMFLYLVPGFILGKAKKAPTAHLSTLSAILIYGLSPCMIMDAVTSLEYSTENLKYMGLFFLFSFVIQCAFIGLLFTLLRKKKGPSTKVGVIASLMGNAGFFGLPIVKALFPDAPEVQCYSMIFVVSMNIIAFTVGAFALTGDKKAINFKNAFLNPTVLTFILAFPLYLFGVRAYVPDFIQNAISLMGTTTTPVCMIILGVRMSTVPLKKLVLSPNLYLISLMKLVLYPLASFGLASLFHLPAAFLGSILILSGTPCASVLFNLSEMLHGDAELPANCIIVSTLLSLLTLPLLSLLLT